MEIHLESDESIRLTNATADVSFEPGEASGLSPFHLLGGSLATCTYSVLASYGENAGIPLDDLSIRVAWEFGGDPYQVTRMEMTLDWPALPESRLEAARRTAARCTVHQTLEHGSEVETRVVRGEPERE